jgi:hypothetical protein
MHSPATNGLTDIEVVNFWLEHVVVCVLPLYLFARRDFAAARLCSAAHILAAAWAFTLLHWTFYEYVDTAFMVNPQFMLCPTLGMQEMFRAFPPALLWPSYRTTVTLIFNAISLVQSTIYLAAVRLVMMLFGRSIAELKDALTREE